ncbi:MAG: MMPL family transporter, partial [Chloroflexi bacterium]|nr:MMPL family transporter [Chloroflexota bacterium]
LPISTNEVVIVQSDTSTVDDAEFEAFVTDLYGKLVALGPDIIRLNTLTNYYQSRDPFTVSQDRNATIMPIVMAGDFDDATSNVDDIIKVVDAANEDAPAGFKVFITGQAVIGNDFQTAGQEGIEKGEKFGVPIAFIILILVFGAVVAALIPIALAFISIIVALGAAALVGQLFALSFFVTNIIFMIGLAVGIDYSLFIIARYREERGRGLEKTDAIVRAGATASRAVLVSGLAVVLALVGMVLVPFNIYIGLGIGAILVVVASVMAALTLLPAVLSLLGDRINRLSIPLVHKAHARFDETRPGGFWDWISHKVMRRPVVSLVLAGGLLLVAAIPVLDLSTGFAGVSTLPDDFRSRQGFDILDEKFSAGNVTPVEIVIEGQIDSQPVQAAIEALKTKMASDPEGAFGQPHPPEINEAGTLQLLSVPVAGDSANVGAKKAIRRLHDEYIPEVFGDPPVARVYVTGETAYTMAFFDTAKKSVFYVFPFVLGMSFILLMVVFRSIIVPIKAIILNLLSVGASYGLLVLVFQKGVGEELGIFKQSDIIEAWIPLFLFSILFGLSMDYHVFLLSRIREHYDQTKDNAGSVAFGIRTTGRLITGAALIMVAVFWGFAAGDIVGLQQMGFGLGVAILLDATIVRMVLVPAEMKLFGKWNWYLPSFLNWLPDIRVEVKREETAPVSSD